MSDTAAIIKIRQLKFSVQGKCIFDDLNMDIMPGQISAIMGPSGVGKSTLLKLMTAQLTPDSGKVWVMGQDINQLSRRALFRLRVQMGMLFQHDALLTDFNVFDNVAYPIREHQALSKKVLYQTVLSKLQAVGLKAAADLKISQLSGGMARRVALARAIALKPALMFYDEPFTGQDPVSMSVLQGLIHRLNKVSGLTSIVVSHDVAETLAIADKIYLLSEQGIVQSGNAEFIRQSTLPWVQQFIGAKPTGPVSFHYQLEKRDGND